MAKEFIGDYGRNELERECALKQRETEQNYFQKIAPKLRRQQKYKKLLEAASQEGVRVDNILDDIPTKIKHLEEIMGYTHLKSKDGEVNIKEAYSQRIGHEYQNAVNRAKKLGGC